MSCRDIPVTDRAHIANHLMSMSYSAGYERTDFTDDTIYSQYIVIYEGKVERHTGTQYDVQQPPASSYQLMDDHRFDRTKTGEEYALSEKHL